MRRGERSPHPAQTGTACREHAMLPPAWLISKSSHCPRKEVPETSLNGPLFTSLLQKCLPSKVNDASTD